MANCDDDSRVPTVEEQEASALRWATEAVEHLQKDMSNHQFETDDVSRVLRKVVFLAAKWHGHKIGPAESNFLLCEEVEAGTREGFYEFCGYPLPASNAEGRA